MSAPSSPEPKPASQTEEKVAPSSKKSSPAKSPAAKKSAATKKATTKKSSVSKKPAPQAKASGHPSWKDLIKECIVDHPDDKRAGVSRPQIKKWAEDKYNIDMSGANVSHMNRAIASGAEVGIFLLPKGVSGKVKLAPKNVASKENEPATKKPATATTSKKPVAKSAPTKRSAATKTSSTKKSTATKKAATSKAPARAALATKSSTVPAKKAAAPKKTATGTKKAPAKKTSSAKSIEKKAAAKTAATKASKAKAKPASSKKAAPTFYPMFFDMIDCEIEAAADNMAKYLEVKHRLMPYIYSLYMLGSSLLVAPVFVPEGEESEYYLPAGRWTSFFHPERVVTGPTWVKEVVPLDDIPVWVRPNTILCLGPEHTGRPDYKLSEGLEARLYELEEGAKVEAVIPTGETGKVAGTVRAERKGAEIRVSVVDGEVGLASISLFDERLQITGVTAGGKVQGKAVEVEKGAKEVIFTV
ncbi:hypothetical protein PUNSTDRAFT_126725 [Punctularia strigosozonata HHB-11173 SS5]|uniref:uncharacterized protein n=1 Tax=Punctularia strigosozonata (strain HHB-11173) TaxID=741275 RepID=UPI00044164C1|nr:uncharacterized protein PUNSTDRAFT_126725 [Punctularia strigosozonata HHB-11173 SS5]EIN07820.1 hypothetical protein PUNSTDRAFT_126725 [Punctularia strigosozonata HHB-11173 SS5]